MNTSKGSLINLNYLTLRRILGILGFFLPLILVIGTRFDIEPSISHFYYTRMGIVFTGILIAFGLFLISYKGYPKETEGLSDNFLTNLGGLLALITAIVPTCCIDNICAAPNGHTDPQINNIHLISAASFFIIMGWMSIFRFTKGDTSDPLKRKRNRIYYLCGIGVWLVLVLIGIGIWTQTDITGIDIFLGETVALVLFGTSWMVKGEALKFMGL